MIHSPITADTRLRDALVAVEIAQAAHDRARKLVRTSDINTTYKRLHAANHALMAIQLKAKRTT